MKRDIELMRNILFYVEENYVPSDFEYIDIKLDDYDTHILKEHCKLLQEAGLVRLADTRTLTFSDNGAYTGNLTNAGYDFLDKVRENTTWNKTKEVIISKGLPLIPQTIGKIASAIIESTVEGVTTAILRNGGIVQ